MASAMLIYRITSYARGHQDGRTVIIYNGEYDTDAVKKEVPFFINFSAYFRHIPGKETG